MQIKFLKNWQGVAWGVECRFAANSEIDMPSAVAETLIATGIAERLEGGSS